MKSGKTTFCLKTENDVVNSPTSIAGEYVINRLKDA